jgi:hypothetical protein
MKAMANRKVRRALNRNYDLELKYSKYKRYFCSWDICDYCSRIPESFEQYYQYEIRRWHDRQMYWWHRSEEYPTRKEVYKDWLRYRNK